MIRWVTKSHFAFLFVASDVEKPKILNISSDVVLKTTHFNISVYWTEPTALDNSGVQTLTSSHQPGDVFAVGNTTVTYTATDASGNVAMESFTVMVIG